MTRAYARSDLRVAGVAPEQQPQRGLEGHARSSIADAFSAWASLDGRAPTGRDAVVLKETSASQVYRLVGAGPTGQSVVAKKRRTQDVLVERSVYRDLRPLLPSAFPRQLGVAEQGESTWIFLEDMGTAKFDVHEPDHVRAFVEWLAQIHLTFTGGVPDGIPSDGSGRYAEHLRSARAWIQRGFEHAGVDRAGQATLRSVDSTILTLEQNWRRLEDIAAVLPATLVHGDLQPKNILVSSVDGRTRIVPIDWETCSWGPPAPDLGSLWFKAKATPKRLEMYRRLVAEPGLSEADVRRAATAGHIFSLVAAMDWVGHRLATDWVAKPLRDLPVFADRATTQMRGLGLG